MGKKILIPLFNKEVAPRFDLASEALIVSQDEKLERTIVLPQVSAEKLCHLILTENIQVVICGAIEDEYYQYLTWKKVMVLDSIAGPYGNVLKRYSQNRLQPGDMLADDST